MNKTIQGVPVEEGAAFINKYFLLPTDMRPTDKVTFSLDEGELQEGYYYMSAKVCRHHSVQKTAMPFQHLHHVKGNTPVGCFHALAANCNAQPQSQFCSGICGLMPSCSGLRQLCQPVSNCEWALHEFP